MTITVQIRKKEIQVEGEPTVEKLLEQLDLVRDSWLVVRRGELLTEDLPLRDGDTITLVAVISGGSQ